MTPEEMDHLIKIWNVVATAPCKFDAILIEDYSQTCSIIFRINKKEVKNK